MDKIKADAQEKGDLGIVAEVCCVTSVVHESWTKVPLDKSSLTIFA